MPKKLPRPGKLRLSPTRLRLYLTCPKAYHYYYVRGLRWGEASAASSFGGSLHRALQTFHDTGALTPPSVEDLVANYHQSWLNAGYQDSAHEAEQRLAGEQILRQYFDSATEAPRETVLVERQVKWEYPRYILTGKLDRLDRLPEGGLEIMDYKSGRHTVSEDEVRGSLAMAVYQLIVSRLYPGVPVLATLLCLPTGERASVQRSAPELDELEQEIHAIAQRILDETAYAPTPGPRCEWCAFRRICPAAWSPEQTTDA
jgi:RecB family exonuclease